ncbi:hypothetical protein Tco_0173924 [Tanacetum coccineum]
MVRVSVRPQTPMLAAIEAPIAAVAAALPSSPPPSLLTPLSSLLLQISSPPLPVPSPPLPLSSPPTHTSPIYAEAPLGYKAAKIRLRAASPPTHHPSEIPSLPLLIPSTTHRDDLPEADMPLWKRALSESQLQIKGLQLLAMSVESKGHCRSECSKLKNQNHGNQVRNEKA